MAENTLRKTPHISPGSFPPSFPQFISTHFIFTFLLSLKHFYHGSIPPPLWPAVRNQEIGVGCSLDAMDPRDSGQWCFSAEEGEGERGREAAGHPGRRRLPGEVAAVRIRPTRRMKGHSSGPGSLRLAPRRPGLHTPRCVPNGRSPARGPTDGSHERS